ncbi:MAG: DUF4232 domain-containing protein, partial [Anaerolineaceae bacterium]
MKHSVFVFILLIAAVLLAACSGTSSATTAPTAPAQPADNAAPAETSAPAEGGAAACKLPQMIILADYTSAASPLVGELTFTNMSGAACQIGGVPIVQMVTSKQKDMKVQQTPASASEAPITLNSGESLKAQFTWSNWCGDAPEGVIFMVSLSGYTGNIAVPLQDPNGQPRLETPKCDQSG